MILFFIIFKIFTMHGLTFDNSVNCSLFLKFMIKVFFKQVNQSKHEEHSGEFVHETQEPYKANGLEDSFEMIVTDDKTSPEKKEDDVVHGEINYILQSQIIWAPQRRLTLSVIVLWCPSIYAF